MPKNTIGIPRPKILIFTFDHQPDVNCYLKTRMARKKEEWVNPRIIDFNLGKWDHEKSIHYISHYNGLYVGCALKPDSGITDMDIANVILNMELTGRMYSSNLSRRVLTVKDKKIKFAISPRRVEVTYALPR